MKTDRKTVQEPAGPQDYEEALQLYKNYLRRHHLLFTRERVVILEAVMARHDHFSVDELHDDLRQSGRTVSRATLYRNLNSLRDAGLLAAIDLGNRYIRYEHVLGHKPHAHLICQDSGEVFEDSSPELETIVEAIARRHHFQVRTFKLQIFGDRENPAPAEKPR